MAESTGVSAAPPKSGRSGHVHEVRFVTYPKLLFVWPLILAGLVFYYPAQWATPKPLSEVATTAEMQASLEGVAGTMAGVPNYSATLETLGWIYIFLALLVFLALGVDVDRNQAVFWVVLFGLFWILGLWLRDVQGITIFGNIYNWFDGMNVQYDRAFGLGMSIILLVPYLLMIGWARLNDRWRITHNEFEHYSFGKLDDSLGRGAKTIRSSFPDVFELILGLAGTLIVYNASGTQELRRIPHVLFLPMVRKKLNRILETTAITAEAIGDEEESGG